MSGAEIIADKSVDVDQMPGTCLLRDQEEAVPQSSTVERLLNRLTRR